MTSFLSPTQQQPIRTKYDYLISDRIKSLNEKFRDLTITSQENMDREFLAFEYPHLLDMNSFVLPSHDVLKEKLGISDEDITIFYELAPHTPDIDYKSEIFYNSHITIFYTVMHKIQDYINRDNAN